MQIFTSQSRYKKWARFVAMLWTLLIFIGCLLPAKNIPDVDAPFADKWVHFVMFGGFTFLWLLAKPVNKLPGLLIMLLAGSGLGVLIEVLQGALPALGRAFEVLDMVADALGALLGIVLFSIAARFSKS